MVFSFPLWGQQIITDHWYWNTKTLKLGLDMIICFLIFMLNIIKTKILINGKKREERQLTTAAQKLTHSIKRDNIWQ